MIKPIQLIKESFATYKANFKKIFWILLPILVISIISNNYLIAFTNMANAEDFSNIPKMIISFFVVLVAILILFLYFDPVLNRAIQKKEDGHDFDSSSAYTFQNKNIFKWIMVNIWGFLYLFYKILPYIVVSVLIVIISVIAENNMGSDNNMNIIAVSTMLSLIVLMVGGVLNITRFVLYKNIFFSKDEISARDAVRESMELGKNKNKQIWILIATLIVVNVLLSVASFIIGFVLGLISVAIPFTSISAETVAYYIGIVFDGAVLTLISTPLMYIIIAKGYVKIRESVVDVGDADMVV